MVYRGPSKGCTTCKRRRVRCDEGRPTCHNCYRLNLTCLGYPHDAVVRFHDETKAVVAEGHRRRQRQLLLRRPREDSDQTIITFWLENYAIAGRTLETSRNHIEYIPHLFQGCTPGSTLHSAVLVLATECACMLAGMGLDAGPVQRHLGRTISRLQRALEDPVESLQDETLMATLILQCRDNLLALANMHEVTSSHYTGAVALIKHRGRLNFRTEISKHMLSSVRSCLISSALKRREPVKNDTEIWIDWSAMPSTPSVQLDRLGLQIAKLQHEFTNEIMYDDGIAARARSLDEQLIAWASDLPAVFQGTYSSSETLPESIVEAGVYGRHCEIFENTQVGHLWNTYRGYRLIVHGVLSRCTSIRESESKRSIGIARAIINDVCASVPFHVGSRMTASCLDSFVDPTSVDFPLLAGIQGDDVIKAAKIRHTIAQGPWNLLGPLAQVYQTLEDNPKIISALPSSQVNWIKAQLDRVVQLHMASSKPAATTFADSPGTAVSTDSESSHLTLECVDKLRAALSSPVRNEDQQQRSTI